MWINIVKSLSISIGKALFNYGFGILKEYSNKTKLEKICKENMKKFCDSSLDSDEFYNYIQSNAFVKLLRTTYLSLHVKNGNYNVTESLCKDIEQKCSKAQYMDIHDFINSIDIIFEQVTNKIIMKNEQLYAMMIMIIRSHKNLMNKITANEEFLLKYINKEPLKRFNEDLINEYHKNCELNFDLMRFTGIAGAERKGTYSLEQLYVKSNFYIYLTETSEFEATHSINEEEINEICINDLFKYNNKFVILGGAGFGKSTFLNYLFCNYEEIYKSSILKIKINLKDYAINIFKKNKKILDCLCEEFTSHVPEDLLASYNVKETIARYLHEGQCMIMFDALDEIDLQSVRDRIRDEIENFCNVYFLNKFFITSREVGYLKNKFNESFLHLKIGEFTETQIKEYAEKWFCVNISKGEQNNLEDKVKFFLFEVDKAKCRTLISNPIILVLALIIFNIEQQLPHKRVEFYKKCIETFLIEREKRKEAFDFKGIENIKGDDSILPKVAFYKFSNTIKNEEYKFTEDELKKLLLKSIDVIDKRNWIEPINRFATYLIERTELIKEVDEDRFDFAHKTFSEYFLAVYFVKCEETSQLMERLNEWIGDSNYDELANLIIEVVIKENVTVQHNTILNNLLNKFEEYCKLSYERGKNYKKYIYKAEDFLNILANLYLSNSLAPRFLEKYHYILMKYPDIVNRRIYNENNIMYNKSLIVNYYEEMCINENEIDCLMRVLFGFRNVFSNNQDIDFSQLNETALKCINLYNNLTNVNIHSINDKLKYFFNEKFEDFRSSGIVFLGVLNLILTANRIHDIDQYAIKLCLFDFKRIGEFKNIIRPKMYFRLLNYCFNNCNMLALTMFAIVHCNMGNGYNSLIRFALDEKNCANIKEDKLIDSYYTVRNNARCLRDIFNKSNCFEEFEEKIRSTNLYSERYTNLYRIIFNDINNSNDIEK